MADQVYLIPSGGLYKDTEQGKVLLVPGIGLVKEQESELGGTIECVVYDEVTVLDIVTTVIGEQKITVVDEITLTDYNSIIVISGIIINVNDEVSIIESVDSATGSLIAFTYTDISINEEIGLSFELFITVADSLTVSEYNTANITAISDLNISTLDVISVLEYTATQNILSNIYTYDSVVLNDITDIICELSGITVYDNIVINENTIVVITVPIGYQIAVSDFITVTEQVAFFTPEYGVNVSDTILVTDAVEFLVAFIVGTLKISVTTECLAIAAEIECLEIFAEVA